MPRRKIAESYSSGPLVQKIAVSLTLNPSLNAYSSNTAKSPRGPKLVAIRPIELTVSRCASSCCQHEIAAGWVVRRNCSAGASAGITSLAAATASAA